MLAGACQFGPTAWVGLRLIHHHHHPNHNPKPTPAWLGGGITRSDANPHPGLKPAGHLGAESATEPTNRRARKRQETKPALTTLIARIVPGVVRECDVLVVPPCSAFRLLSSLSYSHAWPFAVAKATQVGLYTQHATAPAR